MRAVILAGGLGTRITEETQTKPKPMVEVGGKPLLWHVMKTYSAHGITDFVICLGYKGYVIKEFFANYALHLSDVTFDFAEGSVELHDRTVEPWRVKLVDTGAETMTGGRIKRALSHLEPDEAFCLTYGDGVADVDVRALLDFHRASGALATVTAVQPPGRFGAMAVADDRIRSFREKPAGDGGWVNGGFFVCSPGVGGYIAGDATVWEREPLERLAADGELAAFRHPGFFQPVDTLRDLHLLQDLWDRGEAPWKVWD